MTEYVQRKGEMSLGVLEHLFEECAHHPSQAAFMSLQEDLPGYPGIEPAIGCTQVVVTCEQKRIRRLEQFILWLADEILPFEALTKVHEVLCRLALYAPHPVPIPDVSCLKEMVSDLKMGETMLEACQAAANDPSALLGKGGCGQVSALHMDGRDLCVKVTRVFAYDMMHGTADTRSSGELLIPFLMLLEKRLAMPILPIPNVSAALGYGFTPAYATIKGQKRIVGVDMILVMERAVGDGNIFSSSAMYPSSENSLNQTVRLLPLGPLLSVYADAGGCLNHLHARNIVHGDNKAGNCLVEGWGVDARGLLSDMGTAGVVDSNTLRNITSISTTNCFKEERSDGTILNVVTFASDIFSFGLGILGSIFSYSPLGAVQQHANRFASPHVLMERAVRDAEHGLSLLKDRVRQVEEGTFSTTSTSSATTTTSSGSGMAFNKTQRSSTLPTLLSSQHWADLKQGLDFLSTAEGKASRRALMLVFGSTPPSAPASSLPSDESSPSPPLDLSSVILAVQRVGSIFGEGRQVGGMGEVMLDLTNLVSKCVLFGYDVNEWEGEGEEDSSFPPAFTADQLAWELSGMVKRLREVGSGKADLVVDNALFPYSGGEEEALEGAEDLWEEILHFTSSSSTTMQIESAGQTEQEEVEQQGMVFGVGAEQEWEEGLGPVCSGQIRGGDILDQWMGGGRFLTYSGHGVVVLGVTPKVPHKQQPKQQEQEYCQEGRQYSLSEVQAEAVQQWQQYQLEQEEEEEQEGSLVEEEEGVDIWATRQLCCVLGVHKNQAQSQAGAILPSLYPIPALPSLSPSSSPSALSYTELAWIEEVQRVLQGGQAVDHQVLEAYLCFSHWAGLEL